MLAFWDRCCLISNRLKSLLNKVSQPSWVLWASDCLSALRMQMPKCSSALSARVLQVLECPSPLSTQMPFVFPLSALWVPFECPLSALRVKKVFNITGNWLFNGFIELFKNFSEYIFFALANYGNIIFGVIVADFEWAGRCTE